MAAVAVMALPYLSGGGTLSSPISTSAIGASIVSGSQASAARDATAEVAAITDATISEIPATVQAVGQGGGQSSDGSGNDVDGPQNRVMAGSDGQGVVTRTKNDGNSCTSGVTGTPNSAPSVTSAKGIPGTTSSDLAAFALAYDQIRIANCLQPLPLSNIRYNSCLEQRLFWMAEDPSPNPSSAWGHTSTAKRSDGVAIVGCDGDLAGGMDDTGATVAQAWWTSLDHRDSLYEPAYSGSVAGMCVEFAMTHGGISVPGPNEPYAFARSAAIWVRC